MGEKIRDLHEIRFGRSRFMIELNEGYKESEGRLIHIQNPHFRYLINEKGFLNLASTVLRAKAEMEYAKGNPPLKSETKADRLTASSRVNEKTAWLAGALAEEQVDYRLIETGDRIATFLVDPGAKKAFRALMEKKECSRKEHPYGKLFGYTYLYQMKEFELYESGGYYFEVYYQLPCMSLTPQTWIPLDRAIQKNAWERQDTEEGIRVLDDRSYYIYRLCWAVFRDGFFSGRTAAELEQRKQLLQDEPFLQLLGTVFFRFTGPLAKLLAEGKYEEIIPEYYRFADY